MPAREYIHFIVISMLHRRHRFQFESVNNCTHFEACKMDFGMISISFGNHSTTPEKSKSIAETK